MDLLSFVPWSFQQTPYCIADTAKWDAVLSGYEADRTALGESLHQARGAYDRAQRDLAARAAVLHIWSNVPAMQEARNAYQAQEAATVIPAGKEIFVLLDRIRLLAVETATALGHQLPLEQRVALREFVLGKVFPAHHPNACTVEFLEQALATLVSQGGPAGEAQVNVWQPMIDSKRDELNIDNARAQEAYLALQKGHYSQVSLDRETYEALQDTSRNLAGLQRMYHRLLSERPAGGGVDRRRSQHCRA